MAGVKISALPAVAAALLTDQLPVVQGGVTSRETLSQIATLFNANLTFLPLAGGTMSGVIDMNSHKITNLTDPTSAQDAATKFYVDQVAAGLNPIPGVAAATTGALTVTYNNGTAGVGATLTNAGALAAFSIDGVSPSVGARVLIKDQASTLQNGIYTVTTVGSGAVAWVLTRATDYDQPSEISVGDLVAVEAGTVNASSFWYESSTVTAVGTDPITFTAFVSYPLSLSKGGTNASLTASNGGIFYSTATAGAILSGTATAGLALLSGASGAPSWSTSPPITQINVQRVTATGAGTYTPTTGMKYVIVRAQAAGGGSGGCAATDATHGAGSGGGGGGEYIEALFLASDIGASKAYSVGAGGGGGAAGNNAGSAGGNTTFNTTWIVANGGSFGDGCPSLLLANPVTQALGGLGGTGGTVATGTMLRRIAGNGGGLGTVFTNSGAAGIGGAGGSGGGATSIRGTAASSGTANSGAGATGASTTNAAATAGAAGADGFIEFIEFISV